jgi:hypothetical protein
MWVTLVGRGDVGRHSSKGLMGSVVRDSKDGAIEDAVGLDCLGVGLGLRRVV